MQCCCGMQIIQKYFCGKTTSCSYSWYWHKEPWASCVLEIIETALIACTSLRLRTCITGLKPLSIFQTVINMNHWGMSRDPKYFHDPDDFIPDRWLREEESRKDIHPFSSLPFGFGTRSCIGARDKYNYKCGKISYNMANKWQFIQFVFQFPCEW